ncbi:cell division cycle 5-related protein [Carpediemonas membranifera]|uniref:Cell division cycle 5-related protein n=1 Tax=Carpediemonas membranifera TaxID=201153 RepID=A0A8J6APM2_9EUKA|nr:cell division cycle 5-related protein [Carpediemonas membranifera]|eukprot:KAG9390106.1 cell division cycle 5-related protein [Carpediemonas membranifera]
MLIIKGGVWTSTEDEVLKAAVAKYGTNQWQRIASLIRTKTAKLCKARWYSWLDPTIKKTDWKSEEEQKLLMAVRMRPNQWQDIASIVNQGNEVLSRRTPEQCREHYVRMSSRIAQQEDSVDAADILPLEALPARGTEGEPGPDEQDMLLEARARMANTKGKKAKRLERERLMDRGRRQAMLAKRREMAGRGQAMGAIRRTSKAWDIDYATEIPFEHAPPPGLFQSTEAELKKGQLLRKPKQDSKEEEKKDSGVRRTDIDGIDLEDITRVTLPKTKTRDAVSVDVKLQPQAATHAHVRPTVGKSTMADRGWTAGRVGVETVTRTPEECLAEAGRMVQRAVAADDTTYGPDPVPALPMAVVLGEVVRLTKLARARAKGHRARTTDAIQDHTAAVDHYMALRAGLADRRCELAALRHAAELEKSAAERRAAR